MTKSSRVRRTILPLCLKSSNKAGFALACLLTSVCHAQLVFINEIHYDNSGTDTGEFVELLGPAGTDLGDYGLAFYNGANGRVYRTETLSGVITEEAGSGFGALAFAVSGIQNGSPDGLVL